MNALCINNQIFQTDMRALLILSEEKSYYRNFKYLPENIDNIKINFK